MNAICNPENSSFGGMLEANKDIYVNIYIYNSIYLSSERERKGNKDIY